MPPEVENDNDMFGSSPLRHGSFINRALDEVAPTTTKSDPVTGDRVLFRGCSAFVMAHMPILSNGSYMVALVYYGNPPYWEHLDIRKPEHNWETEDVVCSSALPTRTSYEVEAVLRQTNQQQLPEAYFLGPTASTKEHDAP